MEVFRLYAGKRLDSQRKPGCSDSQSQPQNLPILFVFSSSSDKIRRNRLPPRSKTGYPHSPSTGNPQGGPSPGDVQPRCDSPAGERGQSKGGGSAYSHQRDPIFLRSSSLLERPPPDGMLPTPSQNPQADLVIYDGNCQFCCRQVARLHWLDRGARLSFLSLHDPQVSQILPEMSTEELMREMLVVPRGGKGKQQLYGGARAARYLSRRLPLLWWLAPILHLPGSLPLWSWAYQLVARHRYRWNKAHGKADCESGSCDLHFQQPKR